mmetsp:Transcript_4419/g.13537  ORF Transcript_4419/g.13537 Transcript_4419/m.13537 type:complete len:236 (-) Transcript_4419:17-724(-)
MMHESQSQPPAPDINVTRHSTYRLSHPGDPSRPHLSHACATSATRPIASTIRGRPHHTHRRSVGSTMWLHLPAPSRQPLCASLSIWQRDRSVRVRESALRRLREISRPELVQLRLVHRRQLHDLERGAATVLKDLELGLVVKNPLVLDSAEHLRARPSPFEVLGARAGKKHTDESLHLRERVEGSSIARDHCSRVRVRRRCGRCGDERGENEDARVHVRGCVVTASGRGGEPAWR